MRCASCINLLPLLRRFDGKEREQDHRHEYGCVSKMHMDDPPVPARVAFMIDHTGVSSSRQARARVRRRGRRVFGERRRWKASRGRRCPGRAAEHARWEHGAVGEPDYDGECSPERDLGEEPRQPVDGLLNLVALAHVSPGAALLGSSPQLEQHVQELSEVHVPIQDSNYYEETPAQAA